MTDKNDVVAVIAASLYASRATDDAIRAEPPIKALVDEARDLYHRFERAVRISSHRDDGGDAYPASAERPVPSMTGDPR